MHKNFLKQNLRHRISMPVEGIIKTPKYKFKALVRNVIYNLPWLTGKMKKLNTINPELRILLLKKVCYRTNEEMEKICKLLGNYKYFRKYPDEVQQKLSTCMYYWYIPAGKMIVRQGDPGYALFFIFSGECSIEIKDDSEEFDEMIPNEPVIVGHGAMFGEVSLLHGIERTATVRSETEVELLLLRIEDFEEILKKNLEKEWDRIKEGLKLFPYFSYWTEIDTREFCMLSTIKKYPTDDIILGLHPNDNNYSYLILKGKCQVIQTLPLIVSNVRGKRKIQVCLDECQENENIEVVFVQVAIFSRGSIISIGEDMKDRQVTALTEVSLIRCPRYWLTKYNKGNLWTRIADFLNTNIYPSRKVLFQRFMEDKRWAKYRDDLVKQIYMKRAATNFTSIHDVPMSIRVQEKINWECPGFKIKKKST